MSQSNWEIKWDDICKPYSTICERQCLEKWQISWSSSQQLIIVVILTTCFLKEEIQIPFKPKGFQAQWDEWHFEKQELPPNEGYSEKKEKFKGREGEVYLEELEVLPRASGLELFPEIQLSLEMHEGVGGSFQTDIAVTKQNISMQTHLLGLGNSGQSDLVRNHDWKLGGVQVGQALNFRLRSSCPSYSKWESTELFSAAEKYIQSGGLGRFRGREMWT